MPPEPDATREVFAGEMLSVAVERWGTSEREVVQRADSVAILAVDDQRRFVLVKQFREAARRHLFELPAGTVDEGEDPLQAAERELAEETGLRGGAWRRGPTFFSTPGFCRERIHLFFATDLVEGEAEPSGGEEVEVVRWSPGEVRERLDGLEDAKTILGLSLFLRNGP